MSMRMYGRSEKTIEERRKNFRIYFFTAVFSSVSHLDELLNYLAHLHGTL